jgi:hypothetical protein
MNRNARDRNGPRPSERGEVKLGGLIFLLVFLLALYAGYKILPAYYDNYQLQDSMVTEARFALTNRNSASEVQDDVYKEVLRLGVPVDKKDIVVRFPDKTVANNGMVDIDIVYGVDVQFPNYTLHLDFHPHGDNHTI